MMDVETLKEIEQRIEATTAQLLAAKNALQAANECLRMERMKWVLMADAAEAKRHDAS